MIIDAIKKEFDDVNYPKHYRFASIEPLNVIEDWELGFHLGNVVKYIARAEHKGTRLKDLKKAEFYLKRYIDKLEEAEDGLYCEEIE